MPPMSTTACTMPTTRVPWWPPFTPARMLPTPATGRMLSRRPSRPQGRRLTEGTARNDMLGLPPAGQLTGLPDPIGELRFVERVTLPQIEGTRGFGRKVDRRKGREVGAVEQDQLEVGLHRADREQPAVAGHTVPDPVPLDG